MCQPTVSWRAGDLWPSTRQKFSDSIEAVVACEAFLSPLNWLYTSRNEYSVILNPVERGERILGNFFPKSNKVSFSPYVLEFEYNLNVFTM